MENEKEKFEKIISFLENVAADKMLAKNAIGSWPDNIDEEKDKLIANAWHSLSHFMVDDDIREKDKTYSEYQRKELLEFAEKIRKKYQI